ncbi:MAG: hypothetical protein HZC40_12935 [Chloroflexi bacterium]|nr:hypothetical protein [Chloroflexota bacterium]
MKNFWGLVLLALLLAACGEKNTATPGSANTRAPVANPTLAPTKALPANSGITVTNVQTAKQPSGDIQVTGNIATQDNLGLGQIDLAYPETMTLGDSRRIVLRLTPAKQLVSLTPAPAPTNVAGKPGSVWNFGGNLQLYPVMIAQLRALAFDLTPKDAITRTLDGTKEIAWDWIIRANSAGRHDLFVEISIPVVRSGVATEITTDVLQNVPLTIQVVAAPVPTPTPAPIISRIGDSIIANSGAIFVALIGLIGTLIGIWLNARSDQAKAASDAGTKKS